MFFSSSMRFGDSGHRISVPPSLLWFRVFRGVVLLSCCCRAGRAAVVLLSCCCRAAVVLLSCWSCCVSFPLAVFKVEFTFCIPDPKHARKTHVELTFCIPDPKYNRNNMCGMHFLHETCDFHWFLYVFNFFNWFRMIFTVFFCWFAMTSYDLQWFWHDCNEN